MEWDWELAVAYAELDARHCFGSGYHRRHS
jgi:hypothetical protein